MDLSPYILEEAKRHSSVTPQDIVKLCYQAAYGVGHILSDTTRALEYFNDEFESTPADDKLLVEYIGTDVCRVNFSAWKRLTLNPTWLWNLFFASISYETSGNIDEYILQAEKLCKDGKLPFSYSQWDDYIRGYNGEIVSHSPEYRENEKPAYRILTGWSVKLLPIIESIAGCASGVIAIDGRAAAGKSTLAGYLADIISDGIIIKMDDFFLPPELRTPERLAEPGGNIHHERFCEEVLPYIKADYEFQYRKFDCRIMDYDGVTVIPADSWRIVEGVYSGHPVFGDYADIRIFMDIEPGAQHQRIENRDNPKIAKQYFTKWIPMEEAYFRAYKIQEAANLCFTPKK
ncbi:MAG: hypothetical protein FWE11_03495 [Defluviitaleaceae bacterium]|nr:hypothetical protein [Defluviitaleaceae bacterium]